MKQKTLLNREEMVSVETNRKEKISASVKMISISNSLFRCLKIPKIKDKINLSIYLRRYKNKIDGIKGVIVSNLSRMIFIIFL